MVHSKVNKKKGPTRPYRYVITFTLPFNVSRPSVLVPVFFTDWGRRYDYLVLMLTLPPSVVTSLWPQNHPKLGGGLVGSMPSVQHSPISFFCCYQLPPEVFGEPSSVRCHRGRLLQPPTNIPPTIVGTGRVGDSSRTFERDVRAL